MNHRTLNEPDHLRPPRQSRRHIDGLSWRTLKAFVLVAGVLALSTLIATSLMATFGRPITQRDFWFPPAFGLSTLLLLGGSAAMQTAVAAVRRERQRWFRQSLTVSLLIAATFVGVQSFALWGLFAARRSPENASLGVTGFVLALTTLHACHFLLGIVFASVVTVHAWADRYDHEYYWGVHLCAWFWHFLGIVWMMILAVVLIAA